MPNWIKKPLASLLAMLIAFLVLEAVFRVVYQDDQPSFVLDDELIWTLEPGLRTRTMSVNALGLRGPEIALKDPTTARIFVAGDSLVFGGGVKDDETMVARAASDFARDGARLPHDERPIEVLNGGGPGWGMFQMEAAAQRAVARFAPSVVVLVVSPVDIYWQPFPSEQKKREYMAYYRRKMFVHNASKFLTFLYRRFQLARFAPRESRHAVPTENYSVDPEQLWPGEEARLRQLAADCTGRATLVLAVLDDFLERAPGAHLKGHDWLAPKVQALAQSLGVPFIDLAPAVAGRDIKELSLAFSAGDLHYNVLANRLVGEQLVADLYARGIVVKPAR